MRIIALLDNPLHDFSRMSYRRMQACSFLSLNCLVSDFLLRNLMLPTTDQFGIFPSFSFFFLERKKHVIFLSILDSDDDLRSGCRNVCQSPQPFSGLSSPRRSDYKIKYCFQSLLHYPLSLTSIVTFL